MSGFGDFRLMGCQHMGCHCWQVTWQVLMLRFVHLDFDQQAPTRVKLSNVDQVADLSTSCNLLDACRIGLTIFCPKSASSQLYGEPSRLVVNLPQEVGRQVDKLVYIWPSSGRAGRNPGWQDQTSNTCRLPTTRMSTSRQPKDGKRNVSYIDFSFATWSGLHTTLTVKNTYRQNFGLEDCRHATRFPWQPWLGNMARIKVHIIKDKTLFIVYV